MPFARLFPIDAIDAQDDDRTSSEPPGDGEAAKIQRASALPTVPNTSNIAAVVGTSDAQHGVIGTSNSSDRCIGFSNNMAAPPMR
jgi:hypothetical protein